MNSVGLTVASLLATGAIEGLGSKLNSWTLTAIGRLRDIVVKRVGDDPSAQEALNAAADSPTDAATVARLGEIIEKSLGQDEDFARLVVAELRALQASDKASKFAVQIVGGASVGTIVNIERVTGDISF